MTIKELENLKVGDKVVFHKSCHVEDGGQIWTVKEVFLKWAEEPKFTVNCVLSMDAETLKKYKNWKPKLLGGNVLLDIPRDVYKELISPKRRYWPRDTHTFHYTELKVVSGRYSMSE